MNKIMTQSIVVSIKIGSWGFDAIFKEKATYNEKSVRVFQTEKINDDWLLVEIELIDDSITNKSGFVDTIQVMENEEDTGYNIYRNDSKIGYMEYILDDGARCALKIEVVKS